VHALVLDEAARVKEAAWNALLSTMTQTQGPIRVAITSLAPERRFFPRHAEGYESESRRPCDR
jgi:hypothetical protein